MKILIRIVNDSQALLTVDGHEMSIKCIEGITSIFGMPSGENTLGGLIASAITPIVGKILNVCGLVNFDTPPGTTAWTELDECLSNDIYNELN